MYIYIYTQIVMSLRNFNSNIYIYIYIYIYVCIEHKSIFDLIHTVEKCIENTTTLCLYICVYD